jgi:hypothetical protein
MRSVHHEAASFVIAQRLLLCVHRRSSQANFTGLVPKKSMRRSKILLFVRTKLLFSPSRISRTSDKLLVLSWKL